MAMGTEPTPIELRPRFSLHGEENWSLCLRQLRAAGAETKLINQFSYEYGYAAQGKAITAGAIDAAAEKCGLAVHWSN